MEVAQAFIDRSRYYLRAEYLAKIEHCLEQLTDADLWWRPNETSNSVGNLLLHLAGNVRQWIVSGVGGAEDVRRRAEEFTTRAQLPAAELLAQLRTVLEEVDHVLQHLEPAELLETRRIQGRDLTILDAIYHVVEHFSMHTGQIIYLTKLRTGGNLHFYDDRGGAMEKNWL